MILTKGEKYDVTILRFVGWTDGDGTSTEGYHPHHYFDSDDRYLGADQFGIEPIFEIEYCAGSCRK